MQRELGGSKGKGMMKTCIVGNMKKGDSSRVSIVHMGGAIAYFSTSIISSVMPFSTSHGT